MIEDYRQVLQWLIDGIIKLADIIVWHTRRMLLHKIRTAKRMLKYLLFQL